MNNPYSVLGVDKTADADAIKSAYRKLALKYHPDRNPGDREAEERFKEISEAYATLRDPQARARFDRYGTQRPDMSQPDFSQVDWQTLFEEADVQIKWDVRAGAPKTGNPMMDVLFSAMTGVMRQSGLLPGEDRMAALELSLAEASAGVERRVRVPGPSVCPTCRGSGLEHAVSCPQCAGRGVVRSGASVDVSVPAGVKDGVKLRLSGLGGPGTPPGDVLVTVSLKLSPQSALKGNDVYLSVPLTPLELSRGTSLWVEGQDVEVPAGSSGNETLRLRGKGVAGGDLVVQLEQHVWRGIWRSLKDSVRRLRAKGG